MSDFLVFMVGNLDEKHQKKLLKNTGETSFP